jgi:hypothetical protein
MPNLKFLALFGNRIRSIGKEILNCTNLEYLDVSDNLIENIDWEYLPKSLQILNIQGNPVASTISVEEINKQLPKLIVFNDTNLGKTEEVQKEDLEPETATKLAQSVSKEEFANLRPLSRSERPSTNASTSVPIFDKEKLDREYLALVAKIENEDLDDNVDTEKAEEQILSARDHNNAIYEEMQFSSKTWQLETQKQLIAEIESMKEIVSQRREELAAQSKERRKMIENMRANREQIMKNLTNGANSNVEKPHTEQWD